MDHPVDDGVADFPIGGASPRPRSEDRRPIDLEPGPQPVEGPLLELRNRPVGTRTDVDQEVAVLRDDIDEVADQPGGVQAVGLVLLGVVAEGQAESAGGLPDLLLNPVDVAVLAGQEPVRGHPPAVVDDTVGHRLQVVPPQRRDPEVLRSLATVGPFDVVPQHRWPEAVDQLGQLRCRVAREPFVVAAQQEQVAVGLDGRQVRDVPVEGPGEVHPEPRPGGPGRVGELLDQVVSRSPPGRVESGGGGVPQAETVMVFRHGHHVARTGTQHGPDHGVGIEGTGTPAVGEVLVAGALPEPCDVLGAAGRGGDTHGVAVPLGVAVPRVGVLDRYPAVVGFGPGRQREDAPVDEDTQLGVAVPAGDGDVRVVDAEGRAGAFVEVQHPAPRRVIDGVRSGFGLERSKGQVPGTRLRCPSRSRSWSTPPGVRAMTHAFARVNSSGSR